MPHPVVGELIDLLQLERLEEDLFRGQSRDIGTRFVFGGQVLGQALSAAQRTVAEHGRTVHSLHAYFLRAGDIEAPIVYQVERTRDGKSFGTRRVSAIQHGQQIFVMSASFHVDEPGAEHQLTMPEVPRPHELDPPDPIDPLKFSHISAKLQRWLSQTGPFEFRHVYPRDEIKVPKRPPFQHVWFRLIDRVGDEPTLHRALLAYASDFHLVGTTTFPHGISYLQANVQMASLDHAMWFHRPFRADDWLLYDQSAISTGSARGLAGGAIFTSDGTLAVTVVQEGLVRVGQGRA